MVFKIGAMIIVTALVVIAVLYGLFLLWMKVMRVLDKTYREDVELLEAIREETDRLNRAKERNTV